MCLQVIVGVPNATVEASQSSPYVSKVITSALSPTAEGFQAWAAANGVGKVYNGEFDRRTTRLRRLICGPGLGFLMEAHDGISAKIAEEAGFKGLWASGLSVSACLGVRDCNEASWSQVLSVLEFMNAACNLPILVDGDTGYGNFNNARYYVRHLQQAGIAGVCFEDKVFPKTNSLMENGDQSLTTIEEFTGKIRACKASVAEIDPDFVIVARVEAFIAGIGFDEAFKRSKAYAEAGADAILMHSRLNTSVEIDQFMAAWNAYPGRIPVVIVPTNYFTVPTSHFEDTKVDAIIWANHSMRSAVKTMKEVCRVIYEDRSLVRAEPLCVSVKEVFRLQGDAELKKAEELFLPS